MENAKSFALKSQAILEEVPFQILCYSAPVYLPEIDAVQGQPLARTPCWVRKLPDTQTDLGSLLRSLNGHPIYVRAVAFSPDGRRIVTGSATDFAPESEDHTAKVWNPVTGQELLTLMGHSHEVLSVAFSPDGRRIVSAHFIGEIRPSGSEGGVAVTPPSLPLSERGLQPAST